MVLIYDSWSDFFVRLAVFLLGSTLFTWWFFSVDPIVATRVKRGVKMEHTAEGQWMVSTTKGEIWIRDSEEDARALFDKQPGAAAGVRDIRGRRWLKAYLGPIVGLFFVCLATPKRLFKKR